LNRRITDLNRVIDEKADRAEIIVDINKKANSTDVASRFAEILSLVEDSNEDMKKEVRNSIEGMQVRIALSFMTPFSHHFNSS
jgi:hypothetical protein